MNAPLRNELATVTAPVRPAPAAPVRDRLVRRERDFGIGYGRSSGYGCTRRYTSDWAQLRFRCS